MLVASIFMFCAALDGVHCELMEIKTNAGEFMGELDTNIKLGGTVRSVIRFLGIPFAKPPTGNRRFKRPEVPDKHTGLYNATYFRPHCAQSVSDLPFVVNFKRHEDCLYLNVYIPGKQLTKGKVLPVMIWIYGGAFRSGGADIYSGDALSAFNDVIVVTFNYRVNVLGFLSDGSKSSGNFGLWDQQLAIQWVHNNIEAFGGDNSKVTLFGESAGGASVIYHALHGANKKLFQRVIAQSGSALAPWAIQRKPFVTFTNFAKRADCDTGLSESTIDCLRGKTTGELLSYVNSLESFLPSVDGDFISDDPASLFANQTESAKVSLAQLAGLDLLIGVNSEDGAYIISTIWAKFLGRYGVNVGRGVPKSIFDSIFVPGMLTNVMGMSDPLVVKAVLYAYTEWTDKHNTVKVRSSMVNFSSDLLFFVPAILTADKHSEITASKSTYFYEFSHKPWFDSQNGWVKGATHTMEIPYVFGLPDSMKIAAGIPKYVPMVRPADDIHLSTLMMKMWTNFAKFGNPNPDSQFLSQHGYPEWPAYESDHQPYFQFGLNISSQSIKHHLAAERIKFWTELVPALEAKCLASKDPVITTGSSSVLHTRPRVNIRPSPAKRRYRQYSPSALTSSVPKSVLVNMVCTILAIIKV